MIHSWLSRLHCISMSALWVFAVKGESTNRICLCTCTFALWASQCATYQLFSKEICWSSRKSVILRRQLNKNIKFIMLQRRMNNWNIVLDRGIKCLEKMSYVHTSGIGAFYTFGDIFRRTFDRPSGIRWCWYPAETINENRRRVLTKLFDGFCFVPVGTFARCALLRQFRPRAKL